MAGHSTTRRKISDIAPAGVPGIDFLPPELLETIFGFLDVGTLCTARLVCAQFRGAASRLLCSVELSVKTLRSRPETTLNNFPNLRRVTVYDLKEDDLLMLAQSPVGDAVTHLHAVEYPKPVPRHGQNAADGSLLPLPNLLSLDVSHSCRAFPFPQTLRELSLEGPVDDQTANLVTGLTNLSSLRIDELAMRKPFQELTALTALQRLVICSEMSLIPFVAELTLLTNLHLLLKGSLTPLASLSRLSRLVHLGVKHCGSDLDREVLTCAATFTSLRSLDLELHPWEQSAFETVCMAPFSQLTALRLQGYFGCGLDASFLPRFNLEGLQDLSLLHVLNLERDGVAALRRATGLTRLQLRPRSLGASFCLEELGIALSRMSRLRALSLENPTPFSFRTVALLTELTRLEVRGQAFTTNVEVCLGMKNLRVLRIQVDFCPPSASDRITPEILFAIAKLPELRKLWIWGTAGIWRGDLICKVWAWLNADRHDRGWPPLDLRVY